MNVVRFAWRSLRREFGHGDLATVFAALVLGVAVMTAVGTLVNRVELALERSGAEVIGGDFGVRGRQAPDPAWQAEAERQGLATARIVEFPSVVFAGDASQLAEIKAVDAGYPLRGTLQVARERSGLAPEPARAPPPGEAYADARLLSTLGVDVGDSIEFGDGALRVSRLLHTEPDAAGELMQLAPRLLVSLADVERAELLGPSSRVSQRLMVAGDAAAVDAFRDWVQPRAEGFRMVSLADAQRSVGQAFERAGRFLALAALLAVLLAGVATALAANRFALRRTDQVAILRCMGARQNRILATLALQLVMLAVPACALGIAAGMAAQAGLVEILGTLLPARLPLPNAAPALTGAAIGIVLLVGFALPPLLRLRGVPPMRVLNRSYATLPPTSALAYLAALAASVGLAVYATRELELALWVMAGLGALAVSAGLLGALLLWVLGRVQARLRGAARLGLASLLRRRGLGVLQLVGLSLSLCALLLLAAIGPALLRQCQARLPPDAPNYFLMNVQPDQREAVAARLDALGASQVQIEPFSTGRLVGINGAPPPRRGDNDDDRGGSGDPDRPLNFTWRSTFPPANTLVAGRFWEPGSSAAEASVESEFAERYGLALGDTLSVRVGERVLDFAITSLREAQWDSFRVNFFVVVNAGAVGDAGYSLISSFHLPGGRGPELAQVSRAFPNVTLIDIDAILSRVREVMQRVAQAVQLVLGFSLAAGVLVLLAALQSTAAERRFESAVLRTLGARKRQLAAAVTVEFATLGGLAALLAVFGAVLTGEILARQAFEMALELPWEILLGGAAGGLLLAIAAGRFGTRHVLRTPPARALREG
ncbi:ABC transporter permease [Coralloluteibacterium stylophorae]|uniref:FtsX-like permease family protein n=1 Tax=Coralloluteibacterium stylophorae TaxID=1776034 RepID=A0A8J7VT37_9GAMM|nr:FtsX-like permease family protein [Coralloluteibacterium stylophorae]MBS7456101.1 FtsX-like permease family protein [Coralloluteibacterium stylophorae]